MAEMKARVIILLMVLQMEITNIYIINKHRSHPRVFFNVLANRSSNSDSSTIEPICCQREMKSIQES